jgi:hypothetical protein
MVSLVITEEVHSLHCSYISSIAVPITDVGLRLLALLTHCTSRKFAVDIVWQCNNCMYVCFWLVCFLLSLNLTLLLSDV